MAQCSPGVTGLEGPVLTRRHRVLGPNIQCVTGVRESQPNPHVTSGSRGQPVLVSLLFPLHRPVVCVRGLLSPPHRTLMYEPPCRNWRFGKSG